MVPASNNGLAERIIAREARKPYHAHLKVVWDSPTVVQLSDAIPTFAELKISWLPQPVNIPRVGSGTLERPAREYRIIIRWTYDPRTRQTIISASLDNPGSPDGILAIPNDPSSYTGKALAFATGMGPALMGFVNAASGGGNAAVNITALLSLGVVSAAANRIVTNGKVIIRGVQAELRQQSIEVITGARFRAVLDYSVLIGFEVSTGPIRIKSNRPMRIRYKNVGIEFDDTREGLEKLQLIYDKAAFEIEDPGQWDIGGGGILGDLLRVAATRAGAGSTWLEVDLAFALNLGVIKVSGATIRVTFNNAGSVAVELRGLAASVNIPGALRGSGRIAVGNDRRNNQTTISSALDLTIDPARINVQGTLDLNPSRGFVAIRLETRFAAGLPLASSGLGIFGFVGRFVSNGTRDLRNNPDPVEQEIEWYRRDEARDGPKYIDRQGQWAVGLGALVGTLPDNAYTFNALGMLVVEFPNPSVVFGIDANFIKSPMEPTEEGGRNSAGSGSTRLSILGLIVVDPQTAIKLGIRGSYQIEKLLDLQIPVSGYFPFDRTRNAYLRIGSDGQTAEGEGRHGDPVTLTLLPDTLNVRCWAFLMIEEKELRNLGGEPDFDFAGFSIGFGAGWSVEWRAGPIGLKASAKILAGVGTRPLTVVAGIWLHGELSLIIIDISISGRITMKLSPDSSYLSGQLCGSIDLFLFSIRGCVGLSIGDDRDPGIPDAPSPLTGIDLTDRFGRITGKASTVLAEGGVVWPDTVPVLQFKQFMNNPGLTPPPPTPLPREPLPPPPAFRPILQEGGTPTSYLWAGTSELKYAYRLEKIEILERGGAAMRGPFDAVWWLPTHRNGFAPSARASSQERQQATQGGEQEGRQLALFSWHPCPLIRNLVDGGAGIPADPAVTLQRLCQPSPDARKSCVMGRSAMRQDLDTIVMRQEEARGGFFPSVFWVEGEEIYGQFDLDTLANAAASAGLSIRPGSIRILSLPYFAEEEEEEEEGEEEEAEGSNRPPIEEVYELAHITHHLDTLTSLEFSGRFVPALDSAEIVLSVCYDAARPMIRGEHGNLFPEEAAFLLELSDRQREIPQVIGSRGMQGEEEWRAEVIRRTEDEIPEHPYPCTLVRYVPKSPGPWESFRILPLASKRIGIVQICGITWNAAESQRQDQQGRRHLADAINRRSSSSSMAPQGRRPILAPNTQYEIRITYKWEGWRKTDTEHSPPSIDRVQWASLPATRSRTEVYYFRTAPESRNIAATTTEEPPNFYDESVFDPRALQRYLLKFEPDGKGPPQFLSDPILVHFAVDYPEQLLERYGRRLEFKLRRTDPATGELHGRTGPIDIPIALRWMALPTNLLDVADRRMVEAARSTNCLLEPDLGGCTVQVNANNLQPDAEYDLLIVAPKVERSDGAATDEIVIARSHFRTSRYRNPEEMLSALGFSGNDPPNQELPHDFLIATEAEASRMPTSPIPSSDSGRGNNRNIEVNNNNTDFHLEESLKDLGMDPWPLSEFGGRPVVIWKKVVRSEGMPARWQLTGLLIESDEPLNRTGRLSVDSAQVGDRRLQPVRINASGSRILLALSEAFAVGGNSDDDDSNTPMVLSLQLLDRKTQTTITGRRRIGSRPGLLIQEGVT